MSIAHSVAVILRKHVGLEVECIDRMYLNLYVPRLQYGSGVGHFLREHRGYPVASSVLMAPISRAFVAAIEAFVRRQRIPLIVFAKGQRKDDVAAQYRAWFRRPEGVYLVGKAQEKISVFRTRKRRDPISGRCSPELFRSTAMVNQYYFYGVDRHFGPFFLKFSSYFPYSARLCLNGHEYAKCQLARAGVSYVGLDNGFQSCADPERLQAICDGLSAQKIEAFARKWLARLPRPFSAADEAAGYRYDVSILQAEFSLTQVLRRQDTGHVLFEEIIRENLDLGRPDRVQLIFDRRVRRGAPGPFRTRVITYGVSPSLHVDYKHSTIKQYHKEGRALRTETTINNGRDFAIGKRLHNLPAWREVGFQANRRLLSVESLSHDCTIGEAAFHRVVRPVVVGGQRASALSFADPRAQALLQLLPLFRLLPDGFQNRDLRPHLATLLGQDPSTIRSGTMTYHLRRLRLHGLIERKPGTHRYEVTNDGLRAALFISRVHARLLRPGLTAVMHGPDAGDKTLARHFERLDKAIDRYIAGTRLAA